MTLQKETEITNRPEATGLDTRDVKKVVVTSGHYDVEEESGENFGPLITVTPQCTV